MKLFPVQSSSSGYQVRNHTESRRPGWVCWSDPTHRCWCELGTGRSGSSGPPPPCLLQFKVGLEGGLAGGTPSASRWKPQQNSRVKKKTFHWDNEDEARPGPARPLPQLHCTLGVSLRTQVKSSDGELKRKRAELKVSPVFCPQVLVQNVVSQICIRLVPQTEQTHSTDRTAAAYQCSPFCSSAAYSQDGRSIQIHPWRSHSPARSRHCSHCTHLYLRGRRRKIITVITGSISQQHINEPVLPFVCFLALVCYAQVVMYTSLHLTGSHLRSGPVHTWWSLCCTDTENHRGSSHTCDHMSAQKNTHLYL